MHLVNNLVCYLVIHSLKNLGIICGEIVSVLSDVIDISHGKELGDTLCE